MNSSDSHFEAQPPDDDDLVERATTALRGERVPEGPAASLRDATLNALRDAAAAPALPVRHSRSKHTLRILPMNPFAKIAAVLFIAVACGAALFVMTHHPDSPRPTAQTPAPPVPPRVAPTTAQTQPDRGAAPPPAAHDPETAPAIAHAPPVPPAPPVPAPLGAVASVHGHVILQGPVPKRMPIAGISVLRECAIQHQHQPPLDETAVVGDDGELANVAVWVAAGLPDGLKLKPPTEPARLTQKGCMYVPHVVAMMVGQPLLAINEDPFLHNVHTLPAENAPTNLAQPTKDERGQAMKAVTTPEIFKVKCDVHPWMNAWVVAVDNPFFAVTAEDGDYTIDRLPPGHYTLRAWHEKYRTLEQQVTVQAGQTAAVNFTFVAKGR